MKILIADDNEIIRETLTSILEDQGHSLWLARDGEEALRQARKISPDVIILDIMMPKIGGYDVCRTIKNDPELNKTFVIMLSATGQVTEKDHGKKVGADEYIAKPFTPMQIIAKINKCPARTLKNSQ